MQSPKNIDRFKIFNLVCDCVFIRSTQFFEFYYSLL